MPRQILRFWFSVQFGKALENHELDSHRVSIKLAPNNFLWNEPTLWLPVSPSYRWFGYHKPIVSYQWLWQ